ncbi:sugar ABC transporter substrate-binding protein [Candidatus Sumerlaeota bacterium]|nr:sugar ABC transporter substrate-binding protein [Candidatus Sumerlaeota bacterium]
MMRMRVMRALLLIIFGAIILSCTAPKPPAGKTLIEFWDFPRLPAIKKWQEELIAQYNIDHPDVFVRLTRLSWAKGSERLDIAAFSGRPPDVAGGVFKVKYVESGLLAPLDSYLDEPVSKDAKGTFRDDIYPGDLRNVQWRGKTYAFPWYREGFVLLLNRDLFEERKVPLPKDGKWTWDEFIDVMHKMTFDRDGDGKIDVYGVGFNTGKEKWEAYPFLFAEGMKILSDDGRKCIIDSPETRRGIERLLQMEYREKISLPGAGGIQDDTTWTMFTGPGRQLAATSQGLWAMQSVKDQNRQRKEKIASGELSDDAPPPLRVAVALFPQMPGQPQRMASYGVGSLMVFKRPTDPKRTEAAARFARYMTLEMGQAINKEAGLFPVRKAYSDLYKDDPDYSIIAPYTLDSITPPIHPAWSQLDQVIGEQLQLILLGKTDVDTGVKRMQRRCQIVLDDYWASADAEHGS